MVDKYYYAELGDDGKLKNPSVGYGNSGPIMSDANAQGKDLSIKKPTPKRRRGGGSSPQPSIIETSSSQVSDSYVKPEERMSIAKPQQPPTLNQQQLNAVRNNSPPPLSVNPAKPPALDNQGYVKPSIKMLFTNPKVFLNTLRIQRNPAKTEELRQKIQQGYGYTQGGTLLNTQINVNQLSPQQAKYYADYYSGVPVSLAGSTTESKVNQVAYSLNQNIQNKVESDLSPVYQEKVNSYNNALQESVNSGMLPIDKAKEMQSQYLNQINNEYQQEVRNKTQSEYNLRITQETNNILASSKLGNEVNTQYTAGEKIRDYGNLALLGSAPFVPSNALLVLGGTTAAAGYLTKSKPIQELGFNALLGGAIGKFIPSKTITEVNPKTFSLSRGNINVVELPNNRFIAKGTDIIKFYDVKTGTLTETVVVRGRSISIAKDETLNTAGVYSNIVKSQTKQNILGNIKTRSDIYKGVSQARNTGIDTEGYITGTAQTNIERAGVLEKLKITPEKATAEYNPLENQPKTEILTDYKIKLGESSQVNRKFGQDIYSGTLSNSEVKLVSDAYAGKSAETLNRDLGVRNVKIFKPENKIIDLGGEIKPITNFDNLQGGETIISGGNSQQLLKQATGQAAVQQEQVTSKVIEKLSQPTITTKTITQKGITTPQIQIQEQKDFTITQDLSLKSNTLQTTQIQKQKPMPSVPQIQKSSSRSLDMQRNNFGVMEALASEELLGIATKEKQATKLINQNKIFNQNTSIFVDYGIGFPPIGAPIPLSYGTEQYMGSSGRKKGRKPKYTADLGSAFFGSKSKVSRKYKKLLDETTFTGLEFRGLLD